MPISLSSNLSVTATPGSTLIVSGPISELYTGMALSVSGGGTLVLSGRNTYSGPTTVNASTLQIGNGGNGEYIDNTPSITMSNNATVAFNHADALSYDGTIGGSEQFVKAGSGSLIRAGSNALMQSAALNVCANWTLRQSQPLEELPPSDPCVQRPSEIRDCAPHLAAHLRSRQAVAKKLAGDWNPITVAAV